ncbi:uncharacterized protein [Rutidosis leptorrhynchoides]|uniref:uncharacterized protein n=1 Tax=Rutidosis leptorrhynchoides TaxID=125765 RepID=UPI003A99BA54
MENLLRAKGLWHIIEQRIDEPKEDAALNRDIFQQILDRRTSKVVWESMRLKFGVNVKVKKALLNSLRREFEILAMKNAETITDYFARVLAVSNKMRSIGEAIYECLFGTPARGAAPWTPQGGAAALTLAFSSHYRVKSYGVHSLLSKPSPLVVHEQKFKQSNLEGEDHALKIEEYSNVRGRGREANFAEMEEEYQLLLMTYEETSHRVVNSSNAWFLDFGCSYHMCGNRKLFCTLDSSFSHTVKLRNNTKMDVAGKGKGKLVANGSCSAITDVYYVPESSINLLSIGQLQEKMCTVTI